MQSLGFFLPYRCVRETFHPSRDGIRPHTIPFELTQLCDRLELARATAVASAAALQLQNCELDHDIANVLQRHVADVLGLEIERLEALLAAPEELSV